MTLLVASTYAEDLTKVRARAERAWTGGADALEIRIDEYHDDPAELAAYLNEHPDRTWMVTCRSEAEGGCFDGDTAARVSRLIAVAGATDAYVDFELADWQRSSNIRQKVALAAARSRGTGHRLILSTHDYDGMPANLTTLVDEMRRARPRAVAKVAYRGREACDSFAALDLLHEHGSAATAICMGEAGLWSRVLAKKLGAFATYAALTPGEATAPGQVTLEEMIHRYRWGAIDSATRVFGVLGDPIAHSMSPLLFNRWFAEANVNAVYVPLRVRSDCDGLVRFLNGCMDRPWLDVGGFSVTLPHKSTACRWLGDAADAAAQAIGAINTLVCRNDKKSGYNTDSHAAVSSLVDALGCSRSDLSGTTVDVLGTGGAARAVLAGLRDFGPAVTVYGRSMQRTRALADEFDCRPAAWADRTNRTSELLVNATSVGMWPEKQASPMPTGSLAGCKLVFDLVYNPLDTALLKEAAATGAIALSGLDMFVRQAAMQFELWTGRTPETQLAKQLIAREIRSARSNTNVSPRDVRADKPCIALIGFRGCGKSVVGRELVALIGGEHVDTDHRIVERAGRSIAEIFNAEGEAGFRRLEAETLARVVAQRPAAISVGGGAVLNDRNVAALKAVATVVWLTAAPDVLWQRIGADPASNTSRPALTDLDGPEEVRRLLAERSPRYDRAADFTIDTDQKDPRRIAREIAERLAALPPVSP